jgi:hypothetical protein
VTWKQKVESETTNRVTDLQTSIYPTHGSHKTLVHDKSKLQLSIGTGAELGDMFRTLEDDDYDKNPSVEAG